MLASTESRVIYLGAMIHVNGSKCVDLLDTGSRSSNASEVVIYLLEINSIRKGHKVIEILTNATTKKLKIYSAKIIDLKNELERGVLLTLPNPTYYEIISKYNHLGRIQMQHTEKKNLLPIHIIG